MVEIRKLQPIVEIRMPVKRVDQWAVRHTHWKTERRRVDHPPPTPLDTPCVLWQGPLDNHGYGRLNRGGRKLRIHRYIFELYRGKALKPEQTVMHRCDQPLCYRFDHLVLGTIADNNADMKAKGRLVMPKPRAVLAARRKAIVDEFWAGTPTDVLAEKYGLNRHTVQRFIREAREVQPVPPRRPGSRMSLRGVV